MSQQYQKRAKNPSPPLQLRVRDGSRNFIVFARPWQTIPHGDHHAPVRGILARQDYLFLRTSGKDDRHFAWLQWKGRTFYFDTGPALINTGTIVEVVV